MLRRADASSEPESVPAYVPAETSLPAGTGFAFVRRRASVAPRYSGRLEVPTIRTDRLELVSMSPAFLDALLAGRRAEVERLGSLALPADWPDAHDEGFLRLRARQLREDRAAEQWLVRAIVLRAGGRPMVGHAGFHGPPGVNAPGLGDAVEVGYSVFEQYRRRGYAAEAVRGLIEWARAERGIRRFVASVAPGNEPSLAIVRKLGFVETGRHWDDEDGEELEFQLDATG